METVKPAIKSEEQKAREAKNAQRLNARNKAFDTLKELVDKNPDKKYADALAVLRPSLYGLVGGGAGAGKSIADKFIDFVVEKKEATEDAVFKDLKLGRKECAQFIRRHLSKATPENRVWISFDLKTGLYKVAGKGKDAPKDWKGFVPVEGKVELK